MFSDQDKKQIEEIGLTLEEVNHQMDRFKSGFDAIKLSRSATLNNGILKIDNPEKYISTYNLADISVEKFVPASGAASRMFKKLFGFLEQSQSQEAKELITEDADLTQFFDRLTDFAFYDRLKRTIHQNLNKSIEEATQTEVVDTVLNSPGLDYGNLPKGLLDFHEYESEVRTPAYEHVKEGIAYAQKNNQVKIHFTVSPEHISLFQDHVAELKSEISETELCISFSTQKKSTDTSAVNLDFTPFRQDDGSLLFRPAGHGALLENLNQLEADVIFIKNIDNVVPDRLKPETIKYKKILAGVLLEFQQKSFNLLQRLDEGEEIKSEAINLLEQMGFKTNEPNPPIHDLLNRPIRVCGMVKNEGEPGGGPFWVKSGNSESLQIVESAQVNKDDENQESIFNDGTHFNPVDLVCGIRNYRGGKFDLIKYRDPETGFITEKSTAGKKLLAMELPGLWNGSMASWNTIFVEVPSITFNPVKTVFDLLRDQHQPA